MIDILSDYRLSTTVFFLTAVFMLLASFDWPTSKQRVLTALSWTGIFILFINYLDIASWSNLQDAVRLHYHDFYHYYLGSKYYPEVSHHNLYNCTWQAFEELKQSGVVAPDIAAIRALDQPQTIYNGNQLVTQAAQCQQAFEPERWHQFKQDIGFYVALEHPGYSWNHILHDLGNNSPPSWNILPSLLANVVPLNNLTIRLLPLLDLIVFLAVIPLLIRHYYGNSVLMWYLAIYLANPLAQWAWNGGSYFRSFWLLTLVWGLGELSRQRYGRAGALMMLSGLLRIFPVMFFAGAALYLIANHKNSKKPLIAFMMSSLATLAIVFLLSIILFGWQHWLDFVVYVLGRIDPLNGNAIGLLKVSTFYNTLTVPAALTLSGMDEWLATTLYDFNRYWWLIWTVKIVMLMSAAYFAVRSRADVAAVLFGSVAIFTLLSAFTYYYVFLALLPIVVHYFKTDTLWFLPIIFSGVLLLRVVSVSFQQAIGNDPGYYEVAYQSSYIVLFMLAFLLLALSIQASDFNLPRLSGFRSGREEPVRISPVVIIFTSLTVVLLLAIYSFRPVYLPDEGFHEFQEYSIEASNQSAKLTVKPATNSWYGQDYAVVHLSSSDDWVQVNLDVKHDTSYDLDLFLTASSDYDDMNIEVAGRSFTYQQETSFSNPRPRVIKLENLSFLGGRTIRFRGSNTEGPVSLAIDGLRISKYRN